MKVDALPDELISVLDIDAAYEVIPLAGNENDNFLVKTSNQSLIVKKLKGHTTINTEVEAGYRNYLHSKGLPVTPYTILNGDSYVLTVGEHSYVALAYANGVMATQDTQVLAQSAVILAKVHLLEFDTMPKRQSWYRKSYVPESLELIDDIYSDAKESFLEQYANTPDFWNGDIPQGIIHGDIQKDNLIVNAQNSVVSLIDWEEVAVEPLLLDVAHAAQQLSFEQGVCNKELFDTFMSSYQAVRLLTELEKTLFNEALRYTMLVLSVWAHVKMSRGEISDTLFQRVGNYYKASYDIPTV